MTATPHTLTAYLDANWSSTPKLPSLICEVKAVVSYCCLTGSTLSCPLHVILLRHKLCWVWLNTTGNQLHPPRS